MKRMQAEMRTTVSEEMIVHDGETDPIYDDQFTIYPSSLPPQELEEAVVFERLYLYNRLKPCGAAALKNHLRYLGLEQLPSVSTINRILSKHCLTFGQTGWYQVRYR
jgi:hypothetical protein